MKELEHYQTERELWNNPTEALMPRESRGLWVADLLGPSHDETMALGILGFTYRNHNKSKTMHFFDYPN
jgi:hypothetical protein